MCRFYADIVHLHKRLEYLWTLGSTDIQRTEIPGGGYTQNDYNPALQPEVKGNT